MSEVLAQLEKIGSSGGTFEIEQSQTGSASGGNISTITMTAAKSYNKALLIIENGSDSALPIQPTVTTSSGSNELLNEFTCTTTYSKIRMSIFQLNNIAQGSTISISFGKHSCIATLVTA